MKILKTAPIDIAVSDKLKYAGTERIVYALTREYAARELEVLVAGSGDSDLNGFGSLIITTPKSLWAANANGSERKIVKSDETYEDHYRKCLEIAATNGADIIHDHPGQYLVNSDEYLNKKMDIPIITTIHEDVNNNVLSKFEVWKKLLKENRPINFACISNTHRKKFENKLELEFPFFVYNGLEIDKFPYKEEKQNYLFWIGRISDIKGTDLAVQTARLTKMPLIIAGEVHSTYKKMYEETIKPFITKTFEYDSYEVQEAKRNELVYRLDHNETIINENQIYFIGPVDDRQKAAFYRNAKAVLVPNRWDEPFGLICIEGMASGTPIIGTNKGALPEIISHNETGLIVNPHYNNGNLNEKRLVYDVADSVKNIDAIKPYQCRKRVLENFTSKIMADNYLEIYRQLIN